MLSIEAKEEVLRTLLETKSGKEKLSQALYTGFLEMLETKGLDTSTLPRMYKELSGWQKKE